MMDFFSRRWFLSGVVTTSLALAAGAANAEMRSCTYGEQNMCESGAQVFITTPSLTYDVVVGAFSDVVDYARAPWEVFTELDNRVDRLSDDVDERVKLGEEAAEYCKREVFGCR